MKLGFSSVLTIIFVLAKIFGKITWSWWWVLAPTWITVVLFFGLFFVAGFLKGLLED